MYLSCFYSLIIRWTEITQKNRARRSDKIVCAAACRELSNKSQSPKPLKIAEHTGIKAPMEFSTWLEQNDGIRAPPGLRSGAYRVYLAGCLLKQSQKSESQLPRNRAVKREGRRPLRNLQEEFSMVLIIYKSTKCPKRWENVGFFLFKGYLWLIGLNGSRWSVWIPHTYNWLFIVREIPGLS